VQIDKHVDERMPLNNSCIAQHSWFAGNNLVIGTAVKTILRFYRLSSPIVSSENFPIDTQHYAVSLRQASLLLSLSKSVAICCELYKHW